MAFLLDTDICSAHLRSVSHVINRFLQYSGQLNVSVLTVGELLSWTMVTHNVSHFARVPGLTISDWLVP